MSFLLGNKVNIEVYGQSHSPSIGVKIKGLPVGEKVDMVKVNEFLQRRAGGKAKYTTPRKEKDEPSIVSGMDQDGTITDEMVHVEFINGNFRSGDYKTMRVVPRPNHADYVAYKKYDGKLDMAGGGFFSGRMTLPMCFAGAVCLQLLEKQGIKVGAHISSVGALKDDDFDPVSDILEDVPKTGLPVMNEEVAIKMNQLMEDTAALGDSIGGIVECKVVGLPVGVGDPIYDSLESQISYGMFGIPAIKGIEFGLGFKVSEATGSGSNDGFCIKNGEVKCITNNSGGIQGGISNGMPIMFKVAVKPTPSIFKEQKSVDLSTMTETELQIEGRHDSCIVPRVVPCVEAMCGLMIYNAMMGE